MEQMDERARGVDHPPPVPSHDKAPPSIITAPDADTLASKQQDDLAAPTPLTERVLSTSTDTSASREAETVSIASEKAEVSKGEETINRCPT